jgi:hypothetical protein
VKRKEEYWVDIRGDGVLIGVSARNTPFAIVALCCIVPLVCGVCVLVTMIYKDTGGFLISACTAGTYCCLLFLLLFITYLFIGKVEVFISKKTFSDESYIFEGIGKIGRKRYFNRDSVRHIGESFEESSMPHGRFRTGGDLVFTIYEGERKIKIYTTLLDFSRKVFLINQVSKYLGFGERAWY